MDALGKSASKANMILEYLHNVILIRAITNKPPSFVQEFLMGSVEWLISMCEATDWGRGIIRRARIKCTDPLDVVCIEVYKIAYATDKVDPLHLAICFTGILILLDDTVLRSIALRALIIKALARNFE